MEESAQRKERLKAMRMEASQAAAYNVAEHSSVSHGLSNPLVETSANNQGQVAPFAQRFDYYTDPMSAFSGNKQRSKVSPQISQDFSTPPSNTGPRNHEMCPSPALQPQINYSPNQRMHQAQGHYTNIRGMVSPTPSLWNGHTSNYAFPSNPPRGSNFSSPGSSPNFDSGQGRGYWFNNSPRPSSGLGQEGSPSFNSGQGRGPWFNNNPVNGSGQGRGQWFNNSPVHGSGRGREQWFNNSNSPNPNSGRGRGRGSGQSGGRGRGSHDHVTAEARPDLYYNKSMVEDPWKFLEPVIWRTDGVWNTPGSHNSCLPESNSVKKAKVSESPRQQSNSEPSLAEYLAASFNEAVNEEPSV